MMYSKIATLSWCIALGVMVAACSEKTPSASAPAQIAVAPATKVLATIAPDEKPHSGDSSVDPSQPKPFAIVFSEKGHGVVYAAERNGKAFVVHNGRKGRDYDAVFSLALTSDGRRAAYGARSAGTRFMVIDSSEGLGFDEVGPPRFSPDGRHVAYPARRGEQWVMVVDGKEGGEYAGFRDEPFFNADSSMLAYLEKPAHDASTRLVIVDLSHRKRTVREAISGAIATGDRTGIVAVDGSGGAHKVVELDFEKGSVVKEGPKYAKIYGLTLGSDGKHLAYLAEEGGRRLLVLDGRAEALPSGYSPVAAPAVRPDGKGAALAVVAGDKVIVHHAFHSVGKEGRRKYDEINDVTYASDSSRYAFAAKKGDEWTVVVNGAEGPRFDMIVSPTFSPDGRFLVYRARKDGKRFVVVADGNGAVRARHPGYELVFPTMFTAQGNEVAYGVKDGQQLVWRVEKLL